VVALRAFLAMNRKRYFRQGGQAFFIGGNQTFPAEEKSGLVEIKGPVVNGETGAM